MACPVCGAEGAAKVGEKDGHVIVACRSCGLRYVDPMPSDQEIADYYAKYWVNEKNIVNGPRKVRRLTRILRPVLRRVETGGRFLDIGCNTGFACEAARELGFEATGIDVSGDAVEKAKEMYPRCRFIAADLQTFAGGGEMFDAVLCREVVEHLSEAHSFFEALGGVVRVGGVLHLTTPDAGHYRVPKDFVSWKEVIPPEHICFYDRRTLGRMLEQYGFEIVDRQLLLKPSLRVTAMKRR